MGKASKSRKSYRRSTRKFTVTQKKGLPGKQKLIEDIRDCVEKYERLFVFTVENMRNTALKDVRNSWKHSRFFFGKSKVMALALGRTPETEVDENIHKLSCQIRGQRGLLFTDEKKKRVLKWFDNYVEPEFARAGFKAAQTITLPEGELKSLFGEQEFISSMEPNLRKLGLPTALDKGKIILRHEYVVCKEGEVLTGDKAQILKYLGHRLAEFKVTFTCMWEKGGNFELYKPLDDVNERDEGMDDDRDEEMESDNE